MALVEDVLKGNLLTAAAIGATALVLPKLLPALPPPFRSLVKSGLSLLAESEAEAEGGIIDRLAEKALANVLKSLSSPGSAEDQRKAARAAVEDFRQTARNRARRYGRDEKDRSARYARHAAALRRRLTRARSRHTGPKAEALGRLSETLDAA